MVVINDTRSTSPSPYLAPGPAPVVRAPEWGETFKAGFRLENDVVNAVDMMRRPSFKNDDTFDLGKRLKEEDLWTYERDEFLHVRSEDEFQWTMQRRNREKQDKNTLAAAGWGGIAAAITAGVISPTMFIPLVGPAARAGRTGQAALEGAGLMALASGAQEGVLFSSQETRTPGEAAINIAAGTVLGGILGGAAVALRKGEFDKMASDMVNPHGATTISQLPMVHDGSHSLGAAAVGTTDAGGLKKGLANFLSPIGPVTRGIKQEVSPIVRYMTSQFSDAGVRREGHAIGDIAAEGGTIENNIKTYYRHMQQLEEETNKAYNDYIFNGKPPSFGVNQRGVIAGLRTPGKLSKTDFRKEVMMSVWDEDRHAIPQVEQLAKSIRKEIHDPLFKEAKEVGMYKDLEDGGEVLGDASYGMRLYNTDYISAHFNSFVDKLAEHVRKKVETEFQGRLEKLADQTKKDTELVEDLTRPAEEITALRDKFQKELEDLETSRSDELAKIEDEMSAVREERTKQREVKKAGVSIVGQFSPLPDPKPFRDRLIALRDQGGYELQRTQGQRAEIKRRLRNLNKSLVTMTEKHQKKLDRIERAEELQLNTLNRVVRSSQRFLKGMKDLTDKEWAKATKIIRDRFEQTVSALDRAEAQRARVMKMDDPDGDKLWAQDVVVERRNEKLLNLYRKIDDLETFDRPGWTKLIQEGLNESLERARDINARRAVRAKKLEQAAKELDPTTFGTKLKGIKDKIKERSARVIEDYRERGDNIDLAKGTADFKTYAQKIAQQITHKILSTERRMAFHDILQGERGPELARMLDFSSRDFAEFLETDVQQVVRTYVRTLASDISIARKFGTPDAAEWMQKLTDEQNNAMETIKGAKNKKGKDLSDKEIAALEAHMMKFYTESRKDLYVLLERSKGIRGVPKDPRGWAARAATTLLNLNVLRYMGGVLLASVSDPARVVQKYGLHRTMRHTVKMMTGQLKEIKLSMREAQLAGTALDVVLHSRAHAMYDIFDDFRHGTKVEKALQWATTKIGLVALFDPWTAAWKQFTAGLENTVILEAISRTMTGKATKKDIEELAARNLDQRTVEVIWEQLNAKGGAQVNGVWLPETEAWDVARPEVAKALRTYRSALVGTIDDTIVTPGFERPNWIDSGIAGRLLGQFRSFGLSSTTKVLMSGMQQRDMAYFNGMVISLALGALSYYLWAVASGGKAYEEMIGADLDKWIDEMITRSGQTAVLDEVMRIAQRVPGLSPYASFSGTRSSRREGGDLTEAMLGPSFDALEKMNTVIMGADDPTQNTLHTFRQLVPFQNLFEWRQGWDAIEAAIDLPEKRDNTK